MGLVRCDYTFGNPSNLACGEPASPSLSGNRCPAHRWADHGARIMQAAQVNVASDPFTALGDVLGDLHHWADAVGIDWEEVLDRADYHYDAETTGANY